MYLILTALLLSIPQEPEESLNDLYRFPDHNTVIDARSFNLHFRNNLKERYTGHTEDDQLLDIIYEEAKTLYRLWDKLDDAQGDCYPTELRLSKLKSLRLALGEEAWMRGLMPPPVPVWRFKKIE